MLRAWCWIRGLRSRLWPGMWGWVNRWWAGGPNSRASRQAAEQGRPDPREMEAEITALRRRVRLLEKENEFLGKASAFFPSRHQNTSGLN